MIEDIFNQIRLFRAPSNPWKFPGTSITSLGHLCQYLTITRCATATGAAKVVAPSLRHDQCHTALSPVPVPLGAAGCRSRPAEPAEPGPGAAAAGTPALAASAPLPQPCSLQPRSPQPRSPGPRSPRHGAPGPGQSPDAPRREHLCPQHRRDRAVCSLLASRVPASRTSPSPPQSPVPWRGSRSASPTAGETGGGLYPNTCSGLWAHTPRSQRFPSEAQMVPRLRQGCAQCKAGDPQTKALW